MIVHPRLKICTEAKLDLTKAIYDIEEKHGLTMIETLRMLTQAAADYSVYPLRAERHPKNPNKKADEA